MFRLKSGQLVVVDEGFQISGARGVADRTQSRYLIFNRRYLFVDGDEFGSDRGCVQRCEYLASNYGIAA